MGIDSTIEDHRRDPDPHPRLKRRLDEIDATISALTPGSPALVLSDTHPVDVSTGAPSAGTSPQASRGDHQHRIVLPPALDPLLNVTGDGVMMRDLDGTYRATQGPTVTGRITGGSLAASDQAGTGERVVLADADGVQRAEAKATWAPGVPENVIGGGGTTWVLTTPTLSVAISNRMLYADGVYLAKNPAVGLFRSTDGMTWSSVSSAPGGMNNMSYGDGVWIITRNLVGSSAADYQNLYHSYDGGLSWTYTWVPDGDLGAIAYGAGVWCAHKTPGITMKVSLDGGYSWGDVVLPGGGSLRTDYGWGDMAYAAGRFVLGVGASPTGPTKVFTSDDGEFWDLRVASGGDIGGPTTRVYRVLYGNGVWIVLGNGKTILRSTDNGETWSSVTVTTGTENLYDVAYSGGVFVIQSTASILFRSADNGITWAPIITAGVGYAIAAGDTYFSIVGPNRALWSTTGLTPATPDGLVLSHETSFRVRDHEGVGTRMLAADNLGFHRPIAAVKWTGTWLRLSGSDVAVAATDGIVTRTAAGTFASRTLVAPAAGLTITNPAGVAGDPTFALANDLAALEALSTSGVACRTGTNTWAIRSLTAPAAGLTITNPAGTAGNPTFALANDLAALEALAGTGFATHTAANTWAERSIAVGPGLSITNPAGVAGNPTISLWVSPPASATATGTAGQMAYDADYLYLCTATDTWRRIPHVTW